MNLKPKTDVPEREIKDSQSVALELLDRIGKTRKQISGTGCPVVPQRLMSVGRIFATRKI